MLTAIIVITVLLAAVNGANDNIKGAATLFGSGIVGYRAAITLATVATALGGAASILIAHGLLVAFSGKGIVPAEIASSLPFLLSVGFAAALTVGLATWLGLPISTTHALLGGLVGAGFGAVAGNVAVATAFREMLLPLLISPVLAFVFALLIVPIVQRVRARAARAEMCACVTDTETVQAGSVAITSTRVLVGQVDDPICAPENSRRLGTVDASPWIDRLHLASAAAVSFARGVNDTPKIAALMFAAGATGAMSASLLVVVAMALGGLIAARRVADTLAFRVTRMDSGEGFGANLVTSALVIGASRFGVPVSTTHVSAGALFGIAARNRTGAGSVIRNIVLAWVLTLPIAALFAYTMFLIVSRVFN
ncbi:MAG: inorganic phosphate transporter [Dokdonella sp.]